MTTKQQEREALQKIRDIIAELGEGSYLGFAFDGCFEIAEQNLDCDFCTSPKVRLEDTQWKLEQAELRIKTLTNENTEYVAAIEALQKRVLSIDVLETLKGVVAQQCYETEADLNDAASVIVANAENPNSNEFKNAVHRHRMLQNCFNEYRSINDLLGEHIREAFSVR